jgi:hypothetical protein
VAGVGDVPMAIVDEVRMVVVLDALMPAAIPVLVLVPRMLRMRRLALVPVTFVLVVRVAVVQEVNVLFVAHRCVPARGGVRVWMLSVGWVCHLRHRGRPLLPRARTMARACRR